MSTNDLLFALLKNLNLFQECFFVVIGKSIFKYLLGFFYDKDKFMINLYMRLIFIFLIACLSNEVKIFFSEKHALLNLNSY